jgi:hypothetical protein
MKRIIGGLTVLLALLLSGSFALAFISGSTGADGAFNPAANTQLQVPPDGVFNFTTIDIPIGVTVTFIKNEANTPVYILATGDVTIDGTINVSGGNAVSISPGAAGPGGFSGGNGSGSGAGGNGLGPGGGAISHSTANSLQAGGGGGYGTPGQTYAGAGGSTYGDARIIPLIGGSGGAGGNYVGFYPSLGGGGGGGGGAILIASSGAISVSGYILANGGNGDVNENYTQGGGGSGGAIKLVANNISGNGTISAVGGRGDCVNTSYYPDYGGVGRIRLEANTLTRTASTSPMYTFSDPSPVFVANTPSIRITAIGGTAVPETTTGSYGTPDITLPAGTTNPVEVDLSASNIPIGTVITVSVAPQVGGASSYSSTGLSCTQQSSTATASVNLSSTQTCVLMAETTFNIQTAMNYNGEKITKATVVASLSGRSKVTYITASGRRVPAEKLLASLMK